MLSLIEWYQGAFAWKPSPCRFFPSCSNYAHEAIEVHGSWRGLGLTVRRLGRCRPFGGSGIDHVPAAECGRVAFAPEVSTPSIPADEGTTS